MRRNVWIGSLLIIFILFGLGNILSAEDNVIKWKMQSGYPPGDSTYEIHSKEFIRMIETVSNGKIKVDLFTPGSLCAVKEMANAVQHGMIDVGAVYSSHYAGAVPIGDVECGLPFSWSSVDQAEEIFWDPRYRLIDVVREGWAKKGIYYYTPNGCGSYPILLNFTANTIEDLKGHKIRAAGAVAKWFSLVGASPVVIPGSEIYMALKLGTVDGTPFPPTILETLKIKEVIKYVVYPGLVTPPLTGIIINKDSWNSLPEDLRKKLGDENLIRKHFQENAAKYQKTDDVALKIAYDSGVKEIVWTDEVMKKARKVAVEIWDEVGNKDEPSKKAVDILKRFLTDKNLL